MREQRNRTAAVGALVVVGLILVGWLIIKFGEAPAILRGGTYPLRILFAGGIANTREGTELMLAGKRIGQVQKIGFSSDDDLAQGVVVQAKIDRQYRLPRGVRAIESFTSPVMGRAIIHIVIRDASSREMLPLDGSVTIPGEVQSMLDSLLPPTFVPSLETSVRQIGELAEALTPAASELRELMRERPLEAVDREGTQRALANISTTIQRFDLTLKNFNAVIGDPENQDNLRNGLANFRHASQRLGEVLNEMELLANDMRGTSQEFRAGANDARKFLARLDELMQGFSGAGIDTLETFGSAAIAMETLLLRINEGKGTAGLLVNDNRLYEALLELTERMQSAVNQFEEVAKQWQRGDLRFKMF